MSHYIFMQKRYQTPLYLPLLLGLFLLVVIGYSYKSYQRQSMTIRSLQDEVLYWQEANVHTWIMDDSCSDQLLNTNDGVLRIKLSDFKKGK